MRVSPGSGMEEGGASGCAVSGNRSMSSAIPPVSSPVVSTVNSIHT